VDSTFTKITNLPSLPLYCFRDEKRATIGDTDINKYPVEPTPADWPEDPEEYIDDAIQALKDAPEDYDGKCYGESRGVNCGKWYLQPKYCEIWCESETIQPDLLKFQDDINVRVAASGGFISTPYMADCCKYLKTVTNKHDHIERIVILWFGDFDKAGGHISNNIENGLQWYSNELGIKVPIEFRRIAVIPEQVKDPKLKLIENPEKKFNVQLEAFLTTKKKLEIFKKLVREAILECWNEDIYLKNCPPEEYDYAAHGTERPDDIDIDDSYENGEETHREMMFRKINEAFKPGWEKE